MTKRICLRVAFGLAISALVVAAPAGAAQDHVGLIESQILPNIKALASDPRVIGAVKEQNAQNATIGDAEIDRLDKQWRAETKSNSRPMIDAILARDLSRYLGGFKNDARGLYTEIFVMDNKGLNVGQSDMTSDYWQGDEAKWQKTYLAGAGSVLIDDIEFDESTQTFQSQLSVPVTDPATGEVLGAVTVGINVDMLR